MTPITCIEDLRQRYLKRVPRMFVDYCESGSWTETTLRANREALTQMALQQRVAAGVDEVGLRTTLLGREVAMPLALAPVGMAGMQWADGEMLAARAAAAFGVPFTLSTVSVCSIEDVAAAVAQPFWFQLYLMRDRDFMERLIARARAAGCSALVMTLDLPVMGQRHKDIKNGLSSPPRPTLGNLLNLATKPRWCLAQARTRRHGFGNIIGHVKGISDKTSLAAWTLEQFVRGLSWDDVTWVKRQWDGPLVIKGVLDADDARRAVDCGADAVVVSNHGGRQLDGAPASITVLPQIVRAVDAQCEVWFDSGIRSGQDLLKALALGARAGLIGRPWVYGLGAMGEAGVTRALELIARELELTMVLCGVRDVAAVDRDVLFQKESTGPKRSQGG